MDLQWYQKPLRVVQTLLREPDIKDYDVEKVVGYLKSVHANGMVMSSGSVVDFFRHDHEMANPTKFLGERDVFGELLKACHREGIKVIVRVDFRGVEDARFEKHPDWFAVNADGSPKMNESKLHQSCFNGKYRNEYGIYFIKHLLGHYQVDGIWYNAPQSTGVCYCPYCAKKYKDATGEDIPKVGPSLEEYKKPVMSEYRRLKAEWALEHMGRVRDTIKSFGDDRMLIAEIFGVYSSGVAQTGGIDIYTVTPYFDLLIGKAFPGEAQDIAFPSSTMRFLKSIDPAKQTLLLTSFQRNFNRWISENPIDAECWTWEAIGAGGGIWNSTSAGPHPDAFLDRRNSHKEAEALAFLEKNEQVLTGLNHVAETKIFFSGATREIVEFFPQTMQGAERVLNEKHVPYTFLPDRYFGDDALDGVKLLILPNVRTLSAEHADRIREYVKDGGTLIATFETSLFEKDGTQRKDFALADLLGVSYADDKKDTNQGGYQLIRTPHEMLKSIGDTDILMNGGESLVCRAKNATTVATMIPNIHNQPPERAWTDKLETDDVSIAVHSVGKGKVVYFANDITRLALESGHKDFKDVFGAAIDYCLGDDQILETNAPASVRMSLLTNGAGRYVLSMVNYSSSPYRPMTEIVPVRDFDAYLHPPKGELADWKDLQGDGRIHVEAVSDGRIRVHVDQIDVFESVAIEVK